MSARPVSLSSAALPVHAVPSPRGPSVSFGLLEVLTTLAFLIIVLGLMVSLARHVRSGAADRLTRQVLRDLDQALAGPASVAAAGTAVGTAVGQAKGPAVRPALDLPAADAPEAAWADYALRSGGVVRRLIGSDQPVTDAWGNAIAYFPEGRRSIGVAPRDRPFCVSPGPDGRFLTQDDNLYSYEQLPPEAPAGGHGE